MTRLLITLTGFARRICGIRSGVELLGKIGLGMIPNRMVIFNVQTENGGLPFVHFSV